MSDVDDRATPLANDDQTNKILALISEAKNFKQIKYGANESTKALNRGQAEFIVIAADTLPLEIVMHLPILCENKNVPYVFLPSKVSLGRACGISRNVIAVAILSGATKEIQPKIVSIRNELERLNI